MTKGCSDETYDTVVYNINKSVSPDLQSLVVEVLEEIYLPFVRNQLNNMMPRQYTLTQNYFRSLMRKTIKVTTIPTKGGGQIAGKTQPLRVLKLLVWQNLIIILFVMLCCSKIIPHKVPI